MKIEDVKSAAEAIMKQTSILQQQQQKPPKQKKEGQEEFATFVDPFSQPAQNRRLQADKPSHSGHFGHEEKRAPAHAGKSNEGDDLGDTVFIGKYSNRLHARVHVVVVCARCMRFQFFSVHHAS